jgi:microsomal dipeptidase-like Zn-dependent dipeptidase
MEAAPGLYKSMKVTPRIFDLHCDLLSYLGNRPQPDIFEPELGCSIPHLRAGKVRLQVCAIYTGVEPLSPQKAMRQAIIFSGLPLKHKDYFYHPDSVHDINKDANAYKTGIIAAIENASGLANEEEPLDLALSRLEEMRTLCKNLIYISLTHHGENRFGGGNYTRTGLKADGRVLLEYLSGKVICLDLSHTSDALADDILNFRHQKGLDLPIIASHSNFRSVWDHPRNLQDAHAKAIIEDGGLIGLNFVRAFLHNEDPMALYHHLEHGLALGGKDNMAFGADFFYTADHPDKSRIPFYHPAHQNASMYPSILQAWRDGGVQEELLQKLAGENVAAFLARRFFRVPSG